jgi:phosphatidylglycerophosphatase GEP4
LIFVGDRIFTDVVMANRMKENLTPASDRPRPAGPLAIWTTGVWEKESMGMRWMEKTLLETVQKWTSSPPPSDTEAMSRRFVKREVDVEPPVKQSLSSRLWNRLQKR